MLKDLPHLFIFKLIFKLLILYYIKRDQCSMKLWYKKYLISFSYTSALTNSILLFNKNKKKTRTLLIVVVLTPLWVVPKLNLHIYSKYIL